MISKPVEWETELWSYLSMGDGTNCPLYNSCTPRQKGADCYSGETGRELIHQIQKFTEDDEVDWSRIEQFEHKFPSCAESSRIFELVRELAWKFHETGWDKKPPVPDNLISEAADDLPIEVRLVPLKVYHGAIWRLSDGWIVQLNSCDSAARQRFTLFHEIFHVLAHCKATPVFMKRMSREGLFNELLADHFAANILLPYDSVAATWARTKDVSRIAAMYNVPQTVTYLALCGMGLISSFH